jgi:4-amino-4-deoxy-L-arabinose transferase-like glycosyltransferase
MLDYFLQHTPMSWAGPQHPPPTGVVYSLTFQLPGSNLYLLRLISLVIIALTVFATYLAASSLFNKRIGNAGAAIFLFMPATLRVGATALTDLTIAGIVTLVLLLVWRMAEDDRRMRSSIAAGIVAGIGLLIKYTAGLVFAILAGWYAVLPKLRRRWRALVLLTLTALDLLDIWIWIAAATSVLGLQVNTMIDYADVVAARNFGMRLLVRTLLFSLPAARDAAAFGLAGRSRVDCSAYHARLPLHPRQFFSNGHDRSSGQDQGERTHPDQDSVALLPLLCHHAGPARRSHAGFHRAPLTAARKRSFQPTLRGSLGQPAASKADQASEIFELLEPLR